MQLPQNSAIWDTYWKYFKNEIQKKSLDIKASQKKS